MREVYGDFWAYPADVRLITTNGLVKKNGEAVMGRGVALQAKTRYPGLAQCVGGVILAYGNHVQINLGLDAPFGLGIFPTKHNWFEKSDITLIKQSAEELKTMANIYPTLLFLLPRPGTGNGGLLYKDVKPAIEDILPDNVLVITNAP